MPGANRFQKSSLNQLWRVIFELINSDTLGLLIKGFQLLRRTISEQAAGLYEVLDFSHTLELCDAAGRTAIYHKRETVKLLQDYVASYVDRAWGRGELFAAYHCSPGKPVDRYRCGHATCTLISLREVKRRGDVFQIRIDRTVREGFDVTTGWSETTVSHRTRTFEVAVVFPVTRRPKQVSLVEVNGNRTTPLGEKDRAFLPDGRQKYFWKTRRPKLFETYALKWTW